MPNYSLTTFTIDYYISHLKRTTTCTNVQTTTTQTVDPLWTHGRQLKLIHKMFKNAKNMDAPSNHTYKTDRKNLYPAVRFTYSKRYKHK